MSKEHYEESEWIDYLKDSGDHHPDMTRHLSECPVCQSRFDFCKGVVAAVDTENDSPPSSWVLEAVSRLKGNLPKRVSGEVFAGLTFDTLLHTSGGFRSAVVSERRLRFDSTDYQVEITAELAGRRLKSIVGQIRLKRSEAKLSEMYVDLIFAGRKQSVQNSDLGEFYFVLDQELTGDPVELRFRSPTGPCLNVLIPF